MAVKKIITIINKIWFSICWIIFSKGKKCPFEKCDCYVTCHELEVID